VMELLEGTDLERRVRREGSIPPSEVIELLRQVARALDKAHRMGIVHRDLKPENVFLTHRDDGTPCVKLLDFGIARIGADIPKHFATPEGTLVGTPGYMSPEQMQGNLDAVGPASDIWSMGLMAFRLLCGKEFWSGTTLAVICAQVMTIPIPTPTQRGSRLGPEFDAWFARCVARKVEDRFATASEAVLALAQALDVVTVPASRASHPSLVDLGDVVVVPSVVSSTARGLQAPIVDAAAIAAAERLSPISPFELTALAPVDAAPDASRSPSSPGRATDDAVALGAVEEAGDGGRESLAVAPASQGDRRRRVRLFAGVGMAAMGAVLVLLFVVGAVGTGTSGTGASASTAPGAGSPASPPDGAAALHAPPPPFEPDAPANVAATATGEPAASASAEPTPSASAEPAATTSAAPASPSAAPPRTSRAEPAPRTTSPPRPPPAPTSSTSRPREGNKKDQAARLAALSRLCAQGLYSPAECAAKRRAIQGAP
jgi:hypothetical protein